MSTSETVVESPDGSYSVSVTDVWLAMGVDSAEARTLPDGTVRIRIEEAMTVIEDIAGPNATSLQKKQAVRALAGEKVLTQDGERFMSSMQALDVQIDYDMDAKTDELTTHAEELKDAVRPDGQFVFRSY